MPRTTRRPGRQEQITTQVEAQVEAQIAAASSIGDLERLAGIGGAQEDRAAFWMPFCKLPAAQSLDAGVAELKRRIRAHGDHAGLRAHPEATPCLKPLLRTPSPNPACDSAWKKDPCGGVIGVQKGPLC